MGYRPREVRAWLDNNVTICTVSCLRSVVWGIIPKKYKLPMSTDPRCYWRGPMLADCETSYGYESGHTQLEET